MKPSQLIADMLRILDMRDALVGALSRRPILPPVPEDRNMTGLGWAGDRGQRHNRPFDPLPPFTREQQLELFLHGLIGLVQIVAHRDDVNEELREVLHTNHRMVDACAFLGVDPWEDDR